MGKEKAGFLTPKAIANRIKSKGLQKLRWYCQMCQKQCRDDNGFKCHLTSESHQRQLLIFADNPGKFMGSFSSEFKKGYLDILRRQFGGKRVHCNVIYQEYIKEKDHIHMNSTKWQSLTGFVLHCGQAGICKIDHTEKGWFLEYIEQDPEKDRRNKSREKLDLTLEERQRLQVEKQMQRDHDRLRAEGKGLSAEPSEPTELRRETAEEGTCSKTVQIRLASTRQQEAGTSAVSERGLLPSNALLVAARAHEDKSERASLISLQSSRSESRKRSALEDVMLEEERMKEKRNRKPYWLHPGIVVKLVSKKMDTALLNEKAVVEFVEECYTGVVKVLQTGAKLRVDQNHVETVIPQVGRAVLIVNGAYRGQRATLLEIRKATFDCVVELVDGLTAGRRLEAVPYEDVCKIYEPASSSS